MSCLCVTVCFALDWLLFRLCICTDTVHLSVFNVNSFTYMLWQNFWTTVVNIPAYLLDIKSLACKIIMFLIHTFSCKNSVCLLKLYETKLQTCSIYHPTVLSRFKWVVQKKCMCMYCNCGCISYAERQVFFCVYTTKI